MKKYGVYPSGNDTDEIFQKVLISLWKGRKLSEVTKRSDISCWLAVVSGNAALDYFRRKSFKKEPKLISLHEKIDGREIGAILSDKSGAPSNDIINNELGEQLEKALEMLPEKERLIMKLHILHDKKYNEISGMMGTPIGTIASYIRRAKQKLREGLKDYL